MPIRAIIPPALATRAANARMSPAILSNGHLFLTGVTGVADDGSMPEDIETQTRNIFAKLAMVLQEGGATLADIVEMTSYHIGLRDHFDAFDHIRCELLSEPWPAWTAIEAAGLRRPGALVELRVIAALP
jgi:enamine deaminase RidA (YjgF/YER057c/UK114 family)